MKFHDAIFFHRVIGIYTAALDKCKRKFRINLAELNSAYETYHMRILFLKDTYTYANVFYFSVRVSSSLDQRPRKL